MGNLSGRKRFSRLVLDRLPGLTGIDGYFFSPAFEHILSGFFCEMTPHGAYVWRFVYPLFDRFEGFSLLYSYRLPGEDGYIDFKREPKGLVGDIFVSRIEPIVGLANECKSIVDFLTYCRERPGLLRNAHAAMAYGYAQMLEGNKDDALSWLDRAAGDLNEPYSSECRLVMRLASECVDLAKSKILSYESEMRAMAGI